MLDLAEASLRWERVVGMMAALDLDVLIAIDSSRDEIQQGHQRWITGYNPVGGPAAALIDRDGSVELISDRIGTPTAEYYSAQALPVTLVNSFSISTILDRLARRQPNRIGVAEQATFPHALAMALRSLAPVPELVDASHEMQSLRLRKSAKEVGLIRESAAIADAVWERVPDIFKIGRRYYEIVADLDHLVKLHGAEGGFHLLLPMPFLGRPMEALANPERIVPGARYLMEISPRYRGYYSQLTIPVTTYADDDVGLSAYANVVACKQAMQPKMLPGSDLSEIAGSVETFLAARGHALASRSLGHFCGMTLEEPRHDPGKPFILEDGMTLIFHPIIATPHIRSLMRADTYLITQSGAEQLTRYGGGMLTVS